MNRIVTAALLALISLAASLAVAAQATSYSIPRRLNLEPAARREFRKWWLTAARYPGLIPETFFPIGWSKDGKFAYYHEPVDEACGCYFANLVIQDMRSDKVLYEFKYRQDDLMDDKGEMPPEDNIYKLWRKNAKLFNDKLRENGIIAGRSALLGKVFTVGGTKYTITSGTKLGKNPGDDYWDRVNIFTISISSPTGRKQVYSADYSKEEYGFMLDAGVIGAIKSPFEPRVAIVGMEVTKGWEGPPHTGDVRIVGASLRDRR